MWALRILSGAHTGKVLPLKQGRQLLGRSSHCQLKIVSPGVSKEHAELEVTSQSITIKDLGSRNGTAVNGVKAKGARLKVGDRVSFHDITVELITIDDLVQASLASGGGTYGSLALKHEASSNDPGLHSDHGQSETFDHRPNKSFLEMTKIYFDSVIMSGIYQFAQWTEFKIAIGLLIAVYAIVVTVLSSIPMIMILKSSIEEQSRDHARTIAATLARINEGPIREGTHTALSLEPARRSGVTDALIILSDGKIVAPAARAESYVDIPFVHTARTRNSESVKQIDGGTVVAVHPISSYSPDTGVYSPIAFSVVRYDMSSLAIDGGKTLSLFVITLFIALISAGLLYAVLQRLFEHPLEEVNQQMDSALRESHANVTTAYQYPPLERLISNVNSAMARSTESGSPSLAPVLDSDRGPEMQNLVEMMGFPALGFTLGNRVFGAFNQAIQPQLGLDPLRLLHQPMTALSDQSLRKSLEDLLVEVEARPDQVATHQLEINSFNFQILAQGVFGSSQLSYVIFIFVPQGGD